jgi:glycosyltransferase involved in cell wall biosynthesis
VRPLACKKLKSVVDTQADQIRLLPTRGGQGAHAGLRKILHVIEELDGNGGVPRKLLCLLRHSTSQVLSHAFVTMRDSDFERDFSELGAPLYRSATVHPHHIVHAIRQAAQFESPDVIFSHTTRALACAGWVSSRANLPLVHCFHGAVPSVRGRAPSVIVGRAASKMYLQRARLVLANSHFTASTAAHAFSFLGSQLRVIHDPVEPRSELEAASDPADLSVSANGRLRLATIGGLIALREHEVLLDALRHLSDMRIDAELIVIGDGPRSEELRSRARALAITPRIHWLGYRRDIARILARCDIYLNATRTEGFGIAVVEAMLHGLPVVVARAGSHPELLADAVSGLFFKPGDSADLARQVALLALDSTFRERVASNARAHAAAEFSPGRFVSGIQSLVEEVCAK